MSIEERLEAQLSNLANQAKLRHLPRQWQGIDFWSNDYLGFAAELSKQQLTGGAGATGSRLISGDSDEYQAIEARIANYHGRAAALVFTSGYMANVGLLSALPQRGDQIFYDQLIHASLRDGIRLSQAESFSFRHNDLAHLRERLATARGAVFVVTEAVFSMDGDRAPLEEILAICEYYGAALLVDEAHSIGVDGADGAGLVAALGLQERVFASVLTFGKAMGCHGAAIVGSTALKTYLVNFCRPFIFTTGPSPHQWASIAAAYDLLKCIGAKRRAQLAERITVFQELATELLGESAFMPPGGDHPIRWIPCPGNSEVMALEQQLMAKGLLVKAIRHPSVAKGSERLRICLHSFNTANEIADLLQEIATTTNGRI